MACNPFEDYFEDNSSVVVSIKKLESSARVYVRNQGPNGVLIRRILLGFQPDDGLYNILFLRGGGGPNGWIPPAPGGETYLEQTNFDVLFYILNNMQSGTIVQAQAEYHEVDGRSRSCTQTM
jgi:hypothetical protein